MSAMEQARRAICEVLQDGGFMDGDGTLCEIVEADVERIADAVLAALVEQIGLAEEEHFRVLFQGDDDGHEFTRRDEAAEFVETIRSKHSIDQLNRNYEPIAIKRNGRLVTDWREDP